MKINLKKSVWVLLLSFCCIFLSESVALNGAAEDQIPGYISEEPVEDDTRVERKEKDGRYLNLYISEEFCVKIDVLFIFGGWMLLFLIVLEKTQ